MARRQPSLIHRGYLYAQKRQPSAFPAGVEPSTVRMTYARAWRDGYLAAQRDAKNKP